MGSTPPIFFDGIHPFPIILTRESQSMTEPEKSKPSEDPSHLPLEEWTTPELIVEDMGTATRGGPFTSQSPGDDAWYQS